MLTIAHDAEMASRLLDVDHRFQAYDLAHEFTTGMPHPSRHPGYQHSLQRRHGDVIRADNTSSASDLISTGTHIGTHVDALSHYSCGGRMFGGVDATVAQEGGRFSEHGAEAIPVFLTRGLLLDVPGWLGVDVCPETFVITADHLEQLVGGEGAIRPGDVVLIRTGWEQHFTAQPQRYLSNPAGIPGVDGSAAEWLAAQGVSAVGSDTAAFDAIPPANGRLFDLPAHKVLLVDHGIHIIENLRLAELADARAREFLFVMTPLKYAGATASPVRPIACVPSSGA
ncbi:cyclase family protein [Georgenia thermotolerans]|uniref:Cyclase family protein n=1 Tax=Georgenia thermotolerans TaxID=527326 RepID=A0A7J5UTJ7_9MICO|nr:cyclase family protein [Georgenia thermotolerans]KAE8765614.1 cyclase family protein [Georgenia thermotolerans]